MDAAALNALVPSLLTESYPESASWVGGITQPRDAAVLEFLDHEGQQRLVLSSTFEDSGNSGTTKLLTQSLIVNERDWPELDGILKLPIHLAPVEQHSSFEMTEQQLEAFGQSVGGLAPAHLRECWYHDDVAACTQEGSGQSSNENGSRNSSDADNDVDVQPFPSPAPSPTSGPSSASYEGEVSGGENPQTGEGGGTSGDIDVVAPNELPDAPQGWGTMITTEHFNDAGTKYYCTKFEPGERARVVCHVPNSRSP